MNNNCLIAAVQLFSMTMLMSLSVGQILPPRYVNWSIKFRGMTLKVKMSTFLLKRMNLVLFAFK